MKVCYYSEGVGIRKHGMFMSSDWTLAAACWNTLLFNTLKLQIQKPGHDKSKGNPRDQQSEQQWVKLLM